MMKTRAHLGSLTTVFVCQATTLHQCPVLKERRDKAASRLWRIHIEMWAGRSVPVLDALDNELVIVSNGQQFPLVALSSSHYLSLSLSAPGSMSRPSSVDAPASAVSIPSTHETAASRTSGHVSRPSDLASLKARRRPSQIFTSFRPPTHVRHQSASTSLMLLSPNSNPSEAAYASPRDIVRLISPVAHNGSPLSRAGLLQPRSYVSSGSAVTSPPTHAVGQGPAPSRPSQDANSIRDFTMEISGIPLTSPPPLSLSHSRSVSLSGPEPPAPTDEFIFPHPSASASSSIAPSAASSAVDLTASTITNATVTTTATTTTTSTGSNTAVPSAVNTPRAPSPVTHSASALTLLMAEHGSSRESSPGRTRAGDATPRPRRVDVPVSPMRESVAVSQHAEERISVLSPSIASVDEQAPLLGDLEAAHPGYGSGANGRALPGSPGEPRQRVHADGFEEDAVSAVPAFASAMALTWRDHDARRRRAYARRNMHARTHAAEAEADANAHDANAHDANPHTRHARATPAEATPADRNMHTCTPMMQTRPHDPQSDARRRHETRVVGHFTDFSVSLLTYAPRAYRPPQRLSSCAEPETVLLADVLTRASRLTRLEWPARIYPPSLFDSLVNCTPGLTHLCIQGLNLEGAIALQGIRGLSVISFGLDIQQTVPRDYGIMSRMIATIVAGRGNADTLKDVTLFALINNSSRVARFMSGEAISPVVFLMFSAWKHARVWRRFDGIQELSFAIPTRHPDAQDSSTSFLWQVLGSVPNVAKLDLSLNSERSEFIRLASLTPDTVTMPRSYTSNELTYLSLTIDASQNDEDVQGFAAAWFTACPRLYARVVVREASWFSPVVMILYWRRLTMRSPRLDLGSLVGGDAETMPSSAEGSEDFRYE
ncbi:hypothetical protein EVG20_g3414 [Dentipellis fragilis]|uniref:Uncharacterized protein n=1 Tax=Dentipellis fragilis TaxID=205917 RepID=A0A4Y9Z4K5_9AGAM|nr:hypothetical protein EVG20_g3414 [Dentipellis fragilis]